VGPHPKTVVFLTADAFGVFPPIARLTPDLAMYHYISGYTAKVAGTEAGVTQPKATFSPCFGGPFLPLHPMRYAALLGEKLSRHQVGCWLVNTGWSGGPYGVGSRMKLKYTRAIIDAIHSGALAKAPTVDHPIFGFAVPTCCPAVPEEMLQPEQTWSSAAAYRDAAKRLASLFQENFAKYAEKASPEIRSAAPRT
jgi:phosphoenolpyruvate carboxykinase (ATP)